MHRKVIKEDEATAAATDFSSLDVCKDVQARKLDYITKFKHMRCSAYVQDKVSSSTLCNSVLAVHGSKSFGHKHRLASWRVELLPF